MNIVIDLDTTLVDDFGNNLRPGAKKFLISLRKSGHVLILWTNSLRPRAEDILKQHDLAKFFSKVLAREDYDPLGSDGLKDIRKVNGQVLVDDNPAQQKFGKKYGYAVFTVNPFTTFRKVEADELEQVFVKIQKLGSAGSRLKKLFGF